MAADHPAGTTIRRSGCEAGDKWQVNAAANLAIPSAQHQADPAGYQR